MGNLSDRMDFLSKLCLEKDVQLPFHTFHEICQVLYCAERAEWEEISLKEMNYYLNGVKNAT